MATRIHDEKKKRYVQTPVAAGILEVSARTLEKWRSEGHDGPPYRKFGRKVLYDIQELEQWAEAQRRRSTSDPGLDEEHLAMLARLRGVDHG